MHIHLFLYFNDHADINECEDASLNRCSHTCINTNGSYNCLCPYELTLSSDGVTCNGKQVKLEMD